MAESDSQTEETKKSGPANTDTLKSILRHLAHQSPVSEPEQRKLLDLIDNLDLTNDELEEKEAVDDAPPGFEQVPGQPPGTYRRKSE